MAITVYTGDVPNRGMTQVYFNESVQDLLDYIPTFVTGANSTEQNINDAEATTLAARTEAVNAAAAAAVTTGAYGTSTTSLAIGTGTKNFTTQTGKNFVTGMKVIAAYPSDPSGKYMYGTVISYTTGTGALSLSVTEIFGTGTYADWSLTITGPSSGERGFSIVANEAALGTGNFYGESRITEDTGHRWAWLSPGEWVDIDRYIAPTISSAVPIYGDVRGGDITKTSDHILTITPCSCLDSTGLIPLETSINKTLTIPTAANTIYHIFIVKLLADGSIEFRAYTTEAAVASDAQVSAYRWVGFWKTNGSSNCCDGALIAGTLWFTKASEMAVTSKTSPPSGCSTSVSLSSFIPSGRVYEVAIGSQGAIAPGYISIGFDGTNAHHSIYADTNYLGDSDVSAWSHPYSAPKFIPISGTTLYWGDGTYSNSGTFDLRLHAAKLRR